MNVQQADGLKEMSLEEIYASYVDSCVNINAQVMVQQGWQQYQGVSAGSGFVISEDGYIVTNYHVINGASAIKVTLNNGESYDATYIGGEELNDVAVLKIDVSGLKPWCWATPTTWWWVSRCPPSATPWAATPSPRPPGMCPE